MEQNPGSLKKQLLFIFLLGILAFGTALAGVFSLPFFVPLAIVSAIFGLVLLFSRPLLLLSALIILRMSLDYSSQYFTLSLFNITLSLSQIVGLGIATIGIMTLVLKRNELPRFPVNFPALLILLWGAVTFFYSLSPKDTLEELLRFFDLFTLSFLAFITIRKTEDFRTLLLAFFASSLLPIAFGFYQLAFNIGFQDADVSVPRIFGTFSHPNVFSLYLFSMIVLGILYFILFVKSRRERLISLIFLFILTVTLLLTFARVAWVALFLFIFFLALFRYRLLLFPLILFPLVLFTFSTPFQDRVIDSLRPGLDSSIVWRQNLWHDVTTKSIQDGNLWWGNGMDTFPLVSESLRGTRLGSNDPHNDFVKFFVEGGIVGVGVYIIYILSLFFLLLHGYIKSRPKSALRVSFALMTFFFLTLEVSSLSDNVFKNTPVQWVFFIMLGALLSLLQKEKVTKKTSK